MFARDEMRLAPSKTKQCLLSIILENYWEINPRGQGNRRKSTIFVAISIMLISDVAIALSKHFITYLLPINCDRRHFLVNLNFGFYLYLCGIGSVTISLLLSCACHFIRIWYYMCVLFVSVKARNDVGAVAADSSALLLSIVATFVWRNPLLHSSQWSGVVASPSFSRICHFHCCNFIAGVTVSAEIVNNATALDTIERDPRCSDAKHWDGSLDRTTYHRAPAPPQTRLAFVSNKLIRGAG